MNQSVCVGPRLLCPSSGSSKLRPLYLLTTHADIVTTTPMIEVNDHPPPPAVKPETSFSCSHTCRTSIRCAKSCRINPEPLFAQQCHELFKRMEWREFWKRAAESSSLSRPPACGRSGSVLALQAVIRHGDRMYHTVRTYELAQSCGGRHELIVFAQAKEEKSELLPFISWVVPAIST